MSAPRRRGACPALAAPMQTGDGLLIRLSPVSGGFFPSGLIGLCESASRHGNGTIEVTARGSLQFRGFTEDSAAHFAEDVDALGIAVRTGVPVETGPLAGLDPTETADPSPLAEALRLAIHTAGLAEKLGPKVSVVIDGGGAVPIDAIAADIRLTAERRNAHLCWQIAIAGDAATATPLATVPPDAAISTALDLLHRIAALGIDARARDLLGDLDALRSTLPPSVLPDISPARGEIGTSALAAPVADVESEASASKLPISPLEGEMSGRTEGGPKVGRDQWPAPGSGRTEGGELAVVQTPPTPRNPALPLTHSCVALPLALPFGSIDAKTLIALAEAAAAHGVRDIRPAPNRTLLPICPTREVTEALRTAAARLGFITDPDDPRARIAACPGSPACASGLIPARTIAGDIASLLAQPANAGRTLHVSGCVKGCARQAAADITIVGDEKGVALVANGTARHKPVAYSTIDDMRCAVTRLLAAGDTYAAAGNTALEREAR